MKNDMKSRALRLILGLFTAIIIPTTTIACLPQRVLADNVEADTLTFSLGVEQYSMYDEGSFILEDILNHLGETLPEDTQIDYNPDVFELHDSDDGHVFTPKDGGSFDFANESIFYEQDGETHEIEIVFESEPVTYSHNAASEYPADYSSKDAGYITSVKNQGTTDLCWAFSTIAAIEANVNKNSDLYTEEQLNDMKVNGEVNLFEQAAGYFNNYNAGNSDIVLRAMLDWKGIAAYDDTAEGFYTAPLGTPPVGIDDDSALLHVSKYVSISPEDANYIDKLKAQVQEAGAATIGYYSIPEKYENNTGYTCYYSNNVDSGGTNHQVTVVGWSDSFPKGNFKETPENDGAWLCKDSYGTAVRDEGYFWLSYYEPRLNSINAIYVEPASNHDNRYSPVKLPDSIDGIYSLRYTSSAISTLTIFQSEQHETLNEVSFAMPKSQGSDNYSGYRYKISIYPELDPTDVKVYYTLPEPEETIEGTATDVTYLSVDLSVPIEIAKGDTFGIEIEFSDIDTENRIYGYGASKSLSGIGSSYIVYRNTINRTIEEDAANEGCDMAAYTVNREAYDVEFDMQGHGEQIDPIRSIMPNGQIEKPEDPTEESYAFKGWFKDSGCTDPWDFDSDTVNVDTTLYAKWVRLHKITFNAHGGTGTMSAVTVEDGQDVTLSANAYTNGENIFSSWNTEEDGSGISYEDEETLTPTADLTLYAQWAERVQHRVTFDMQGHGDQIDVIIANDGSTISKPEDPVASGFTFLGWFRESECENIWSFSTDTVTGNTTLYAKWVNDSATIHRVTFDTDGKATVPDVQLIEDGGHVYEPAEPAAEGFAFGGWFKTSALSEPWDFENDTVTGDQTLYASWVDISSVLSITGQPEGVTTTYGEGNSHTMTVTATTPVTGTTINYQWYKVGTSGDEPISGATGASYTADTSGYGDSRYYCAVSVVKNSTGRTLATVNTDTVRVLVNKRSLIISDVLGTDKTYDGTATAYLNTEHANITGLLDGDSVSVVAVGRFENAHAGDSKQISITSYELIGDDVRNYTVDEAASQQTATADILKKHISPTVEIRGTYVYMKLPITPTLTVKDGTTELSSSDYDAVFDDNLQAGTAHVTIKEPGAGGDYEFDDVTKPFEIQKKEVTVSGITARNKTYDGSTDATFDCSDISIHGLIGGDQVSVDAEGHFETATAGTGKKVVITAITLSGSDADNYILAEEGQQEEATADITSRSVTAEAEIRGTYVYDGEDIIPDIVVTAGETEIGSDSYDLSLSDNRNAGTASYTVSSKGNYTFPDITGTFDIARAGVNVTADNKVKGLGGRDPELTVSITGLKGSDAPSLIRYTISRAAGEEVGEYAITPSGDAIQGNYEVAYVPGTLTISEKTAKELAVTQASVTYGTVLPDPVFDRPASSVSIDILYSGTLRKNGETYGPTSTKPTEAGSYTVSVAYETDTQICTGTSEVFKIDPAAMSSATVTLKNSLTYNGTEQTQEVESIKFNDSDISSLCTIQNQKARDAGSYVLKVTVDEASNFTGSKDIPYTVAKAVLTVKADDASKTYGEADPELKYTITGMIEGETGFISGSLERSGGEHAGEYDILQGTLTPGSNYSIDYTKGVLTIRKASHSSITLSDKVYVPSTGTDKITVNLSAVLEDGAGMVSHTESGTLGGRISNVGLYDSTLSFAIGSSNVGDTGSMTITVRCRDYDDYNVTLNLESSSKTAEVIIPSSGPIRSAKAPGLTAYAQALPEPNVDVRLNVATKTEATVPSSIWSAIKDAVMKAYNGLAQSLVGFDIFDFTVTKTADGSTSPVTDLGTVIELEMEYDMTGKFAPVIVREHDGSVAIFTALQERPGSGYEDGTFYYDGSGKLYLYTRYFSTYTVAYSKQDICRVTFDYNTGTKSTVTVAKGSTVSKPTDPTRSGYTFIGWYGPDGTLYNFANAVKSDITITAGWKANPGSSGGSGSSGSSGGDNKEVKETVEIVNVFKDAWDRIRGFRDGSGTSRTSSPSNAGDSSDGKASSAKTADTLPSILFWVGIITVITVLVTYLIWSEEQERESISDTKDK